MFKTLYIVEYNTVRKGITLFTTNIKHSVYTGLNEEKIFSKIYESSQNKRLYESIDRDI
jgi:hypothetical protein